MCRGLETFDREFLFCVEWNFAVLKHGQYFGIIGGIADEGDALVIFGGGANERDTADINIFNGISVSDVGFRYRLFKRIKIDGYEINIIPADGE